MYDYTERLNRPTEDKLAEFERNGRLKHVLFAAQLDRSLIQELNLAASAIERLAGQRAGKTFLGSLLADKSIMLYFTQASTRTFLSFSRACRLLGVHTEDIRDPALSSEFKGESKIDSMRMFSTYFDAIVMRSGEPALAEECAYLMNDLEGGRQHSIPIINGGSGADEHPTQALLDMLTIDKAFAFPVSSQSSQRELDQVRSLAPSFERGVDGKRFVFCGDMARGRTIRSLAVLLAQYEAIEMMFVSPRGHELALQPKQRFELERAGVAVTEHTSLAEVIDRADIVYMTRIQSEHGDRSSAAQVYDAPELAACRLTPDLVERMPSHAKILHPFPRNDEIPTVVDGDHRALYFKQAQHGIWARAAIIAHIFDVDRKIAAHLASQTADRHDYNEAVLRT